MNELVVNTLLLITGSATVVLSLLVFHLWRVSFQLREDFRSLAGAVSAFGSDIAGLCQAGVCQDGRISTHSRQLQELVDKIEVISYQDQSGQSFHAAISAARKGADVQSLIERYGLTRDEAELLIRLHGSATALME